MADRNDTMRHALDAVADFAGAIIYMADGALSKGPDYESAAYLEGIKALAEKTQMAIEPAAAALTDDTSELNQRPAMPSVPATPGGETAAGARVVIDLLHTIKGISDATAGRPGGRDYADMQDAIDAALLDGTCGSIERRQGFVLALADLLCINADGGGVAVETWDPLTAIANEGRRTERMPGQVTRATSPAATQAGIPAPADIPGHLAMLGREATYEIAALAQALVEQYGQVTSEDQRPLVVRGMALRIHELNSHVMSLLDVPEEFASGPNGRHMRDRIMGEGGSHD